LGNESDGPSTLGHRARPLTVIAVIVVLVAYSVVAALLEPFTRPSEVIIGLGIVGVVAVAVAAGWHHRGANGPVPPVLGRHWKRGVAVWVSLIAAIGLFQMAQFQSNPRDVYPTLSSLASIAFGTWPIRAAAIAAWMALGLYIIGPRARALAR
jgi:hypothetical protein